MPFFHQQWRPLSEITTGSGLAANLRIGLGFLSYFKRILS